MDAQDLYQEIHMQHKEIKLSMPLNTFITTFRYTISSIEFYEKLSIENI